MKPAKPTKQTLILASSSVYRRELLQKLQIPFSSVSPKIDESALAGEKPHETARARWIVGVDVQWNVECGA